MFRSSAKYEQFARVPDFYSGKSVFLTGAAGFVGSVLLEILLRCCPGIQSIYILLRSKKNVRPEVRKEQIFGKKIFEKLKEEQPKLLQKVCVISGDASLPNLGMKEEDMQLLIEEVSIVFHCAAITNFSKPLQYVLLNNVMSLHTVIGLCKKMRKFKALVYTSTAYSNCNHTKFTFKEKVYRLPFRAEEFLDAVKNDDTEQLQELYEHCKPDWTNSYIFSKCLAENVIMDTAANLPVAIIRPSIVVTTHKHPMPGYVEGNSGIAALTLGVGKGFVKVLFADPNSKLNFVPADIVANAHVVAAWSIGTERCTSPFIVNCTATDNFNVKLKDYNFAMSQLIHKCPLPQAFKEYTRLIIAPNRYIYYIVSAYHHYLPATVMDTMLRIFGKKPRLYSLYRFFDVVMSSLSFFMFHSFEFDRNNIEYLDKLIHPEDRKELALDFRDANFLELTLKLPDNCLFYDWKIDRKSMNERQRTIHRRQMLTDFIQGVFIVMFCLLMYRVVTLVFL